MSQSLKRYNKRFKTVAVDPMIKLRINNEPSLSARDKALYLDILRVPHHLRSDRQQLIIDSIDRQLFGV